ncbi:MAG: outer membrane protein assembly factor BamD [Planctomycetota bacterium]|nr:outer membrane protein assembly factor BamD [Planctomycetota bacterium]
MNLLPAAPRAALAIFACALALSLAAGGCGSGRSSRDRSSATAPISDAEVRLAEGSSAQTIAQARRLIADERFAQAKSLLDDWIAAPGARRLGVYPEAVYLRGVAKLGDDREYDALYDFEEVVKNYPASEFFASSLEREFEIAKDYLAGKRIRYLGLRIGDGIAEAEEILTRINERMPGSRLAEQALLELGDFYYRTRNLKMAAEVYDVFLSLFPRSEHRSKAMQRRAFANIAQYRGPQHDARGLIEAKYQIEQFQREFPLDAERVGMSDALQARLDESAAEQMLATARWHLDRDDQVAARYALTRLLNAYPQTGAARDALALLQRNNWPLPGAENTPGTDVPPNADSPPNAPDEPAPAEATP